MALYLKIDRVSSAELERSDLGDNPGRALQKAQVWLPLVISPRPDFDRATQTLSARLDVPDLSNLDVNVPADAVVFQEWDVVALPPAPLPENTPTTLEDLERAVYGLFPSRGDAVAALTQAKRNRGTAL